MKKIKPDRITCENVGIDEILHNPLVQQFATMPGDIYDSLSPSHITMRVAVDVVKQAMDKYQTFGSINESKRALCENVDCREE